MRAEAERDRAAKGERQRLGRPQANGEAAKPEQSTQPGENQVGAHFRIRDDRAKAEKPGVDRRHQPMRRENRSGGKHEAHENVEQADGSIA